MGNRDIFGHPTGICDWCGTRGQKLYEYNSKDVCAPCRNILMDYDKVGAIEEASEKIHKVIKHADKYYPYP